MNTSEDLEAKPEATIPPAVAEQKPIDPKEAKRLKRQKTRSEVRQILRGVFSWGAFQLMLAHHPNCETFDSHVFKIGKLRLCRGCFLSYPPLYTLIALYIFWLPSREFFLREAIPIVDNLWWFVIGFGILTFASRWLGRYHIIINDIAKLSRGIWTGLLVIVIISQHWGFKIGAALIIIGGMTYLSLQRGKDMERTCDECEWHSDFNSCPGWDGIADKLFPANTATTGNKPIERPVKLPTDNPEEDKPESNN